MYSDLIKQLSENYYEGEIEMAMNTKSGKWFVRPGYAFSAGIGVGATAFVFDFLNMEDNQIYGLLFTGLGLAGGLGSGKSSGLKSVIDVAKTLGKQVAKKAVGWKIGGFKTTYPIRTWTPVSTGRGFSGDDLHHSNGRLTVLGLSALGLGSYKCYVSAASWGFDSPYFNSQEVAVLPQTLDMQMSATVGMWFVVFDIPNSENASYGYPETAFGLQNP